jgi:hypothetical protein
VPDTSISEPNSIPLRCFYKGCIQSKQQLALSRLMHNIHCGRAVFQYQALERRTAQQTLMGCAGRITKKFEGIKNIPLQGTEISVFKLKKDKK